MRVWRAINYWRLLMFQKHCFLNPKKFQSQAAAQRARSPGGKKGLAFVTEVRNFGRQEELARRPNLEEVGLLRPRRFGRACKIFVRVTKLQKRARDACSLFSNRVEGFFSQVQDGVQPSCSRRGGTVDGDVVASDVAHAVPNHVDLGLGGGELDGPSRRPACVCVCCVFLFSSCIFGWGLFGPCQQQGRVAASHGKPSPATKSNPPLQPRLRRWQEGRRLTSGPGNSSGIRWAEGPGDPCATRGRAGSAARGALRAAAVGVTHEARVDDRRGANAPFDDHKPAI